MGADRLRWWGAVVVVGVAGGLVGGVLTLALHAVQHAAFGYTENTFLFGVEQASALRRVVVLALAGVVAGAGWTVLRRRGRVGDVTTAVSDERSDLPLLDTSADGMLQVVVVGMGASLGREGAPRQVTAALAAWLAERMGLPTERRRVLIALGAGAGLAAVYDVPFAGALFAAEVVLATYSWRLLAAAGVASWVATCTSWLLLPNEAAYPVHGLHAGWSVVVWSVLVGPVVALAGRLFVLLSSWARRHRPPERWLLVALPTVFTGLGLLSVGFPQLLGNGKGPAQLGFDASIGLGLAAVLMVLKPLVTAACLRAGAVGGLLTPSLATGAALGVLCGGAWALWWPAGVGACALVAAGAMVASTQRAPWTALALALELTRPDRSVVIPLVIAILGATLTGRVLGRRSGDGEEVLEPAVTA